MARLYVRPCSETEAAQKWTEMGDGRIALAESSGTSKFYLLLSLWALGERVLWEGERRELGKGKGREWV